MEVCLQLILSQELMLLISKKLLGLNALYYFFIYGVKRAGITDGLEFGGVLGGSLNSEKTTNATNERTRAFGESITPGTTNKVRSALYQTTSFKLYIFFSIIFYQRLSVPAIKESTLSSTTRSGGFGTKLPAPQPSPSKNLNIPHSTGLSSGFLEFNLISSH
jgi:hypothetical protein